MYNYVDNWCYHIDGDDNDVQYLHEAAVNVPETRNAL